MPANVEIKARVRDRAELLRNAERLSGSPGCVILQTDTFFPAPNGRLKLRDFRAVLSQALGVQGTVKKERRLYLVGQTRIHVDRVEGLGDFMELEVVLQEQQSPQEGEDVARRLMKELGVCQEDLLAGAYLDLLLAGGEPRP